jgi:outer membrane protein W
MRKRVVAMVSLLALVAVPAFAQHEPKGEVGVVFGWVFSDGVSGNTIVVPGAGSFNRIDPKDSFGWGAEVGFFVSPNWEVGFLFGQQPSKLVLGGVAGTADREVGNAGIYTYHGTFTYNFFEPDAKIRPYIMGGLGATNFASVGYTRADNGQSGEFGGATKFSSTWGAGVKIYGASRVGGRFGVRWTPTYIKSDPGGYWCDPYWGCYVVGDPQYANQFEINGGITLKF